MSEHAVASADEIDEGERILVEVDGTEIGVFNVDGDYYAYANRCLHQYGPVCEGSLTGTWREQFDPERLDTDAEWVRDGEILNCPWHGWEFDVTTGECLSLPGSGSALPAYPVEERDGQIVVEV